MKAGRRNLKQGALLGSFEPQPGQAIMRVVSSRGSNVMEVEDSDGEKTLCMLPAKFRKSMWIKTGNYVLVEEGDRGKAADSGNKVTGTIVQVLYADQVQKLRKTSFWPASFQDLSDEACVAAEIPPVDDASKSLVEHDGNEEESDEEDGLPPLEANRNREEPGGLWHESSSDSDSDDE